MAVTHYPPDRTKARGNALAGWINQLETAIEGYLGEVQTLIDDIDGGEANAGDDTKYNDVVGRYGFRSNADAKAAEGELATVKGALESHTAAFNQLFERLRG